MSEIDFTKKVWANHADYPKVLVIGTFDILHYGHFRFLREAAKLGTVIVALGTDPFQTEHKRKPTLTYWERKAGLVMLPWVEDVIARDTLWTRNIISIVQPKYLPYGSDWVLADYLEGNGLTQDYIDKHELQMVRIVRSGGMSSSKIIQRCAEIAKA